MDIRINVNVDAVDTDLLVWTVETLGLPGDQFTYHPGEEYVQFKFTNRDAAMIFQLRAGGVWESH